jgi:hypothetical protein
MGYANPVITLPFKELSSDWETDPIRVTIRNPRLVPPAELRPKGLDSEDEGEVMLASFEVMARLIVGWRVYDASAPIELDAEGNVVGEQPLLPLPATAALVAKLPLEIVQRLGEEVKQAGDPR